MTGKLDRIEAILECTDKLLATLLHLVENDEK